MCKLYKRDGYLFVPYNYLLKDIFMCETLPWESEVMSSGFFAVSPEILGIWSSQAEWIILPSCHYKIVSNYILQQRYNLNIHTAVEYQDVTRLAHLVCAYVYLQKRRRQIQVENMIPARMQLFSIDPRFSIQTQFVISYLHADIPREDALIDIALIDNIEVFDNAIRMQLFEQVSKDISVKIEANQRHIVQRDLQIKHPSDLVSQAESKHEELNFRHLGGTRTRTIIQTKYEPIDNIADNLQKVGLLSIKRIF
jgi:hypothetical protein